MGAISKYVKRLKQHDRGLNNIYLIKKYPTAEKLAELNYYLLKYRNVVDTINLSFNCLTDHECIQMIPYIETSSTIRSLLLVKNNLTAEAYLEVAAALQRNSSLRLLYLFSNRLVDKTLIDAAFVDALRINPSRPAHSNWVLYAGDQQDFNRLNDVAKKSKPPSFLEFLLNVHVDAEIITTKIH